MGSCYSSEIPEIRIKSKCCIRCRACIFCCRPCYAAKSTCCNCNIYIESDGPTHHETNNTTTRN